MYYNHNLKTSLQEWKARLTKASIVQFSNQLKFLINNLENNKILFGFIQEAILKYKLTEDELDKYNSFNKVFAPPTFIDELQQVSFCYSTLKYYFQQFEIQGVDRCFSGDFEILKAKFIENLITPIIYYLQDKLDKSNSTIYLLERYKRRTEWFTSEELKMKYELANEKYEEIFQDHLSLFLFDNGIDYVFSTPKSNSGRADIIASIETDNPIVIEIKIYDGKKNIGKTKSSKVSLK